MSRGVRWWAVAVTAAVSFLLLVVALAAGSALDPAAPDRLLELDRGDIAAVMRPVLFVAYLAILLHALYLWMSRPDRPAGGSARRRSTYRLFLLGLLVALGLAILLASWEPPVPAGESPPASPAAGPSEGEGTASPVPSRSGLVAAGLGVLVLLVVGVALASRHRRLAPPSSASPLSGPAPSPAGPREARPADPRERVFAAYRQVERVAGRTGRDRAVGETVAAHLGRLPAVGAGRRLASLYNRARFSTHPLVDGEAAAAERAGSELDEALE